ncbi:MAG: hypothetical protein K2P81_05970 [Bacteriovoracaceae bacterium]|nr:hypothetical protein [Bacteriovoracaceae bacterium]
MMFNISTHLRSCLKIRHLLVVLAICAWAPIHQSDSIVYEGRKPANYVPNDDVIVLPIEAKMTFYEKNILNDKNWSDKSLVQRQIKIWQENELMAQRYGLDSTSIGSLYYVPTNDEKFQYLRRSYFRYLQKKGEDPFQRQGQQIINNWTANDEVNSIDEMEAAFRSTRERDGVGRSLPQAFREKQIAKTKKFKFHFQPRVEQGLIILRMEGPIVDARAWVGVNGQAEINVERSFDATGTRFFVNYYAQQGRYLTNVDQTLFVTGLRARFTSTKDPSQTAPELANEQRYQVLYGREF